MEQTYFRKGFGLKDEVQPLIDSEYQSALVERIRSRGYTDTFGDVTRRVLGFLKRTQSLTSRDPGVRGGIKGSFPVYGDYGKARVLNWATKFFIDALLLEESQGSCGPIG